MRADVGSPGTDPVPGPVRPSGRCFVRSGRLGGDGDARGLGDHVVRFVSLNLDLDDAMLLRQALILAVGNCACGSDVGQRRCTACISRNSLLSELDRVIERADSGVRRRAGDVAEVQDLWLGTGFAAAARPASALRLIPGGLLDD